MRYNNIGGVNMNEINMFINYIKNRKNYSDNTVDAYLTDLTNFHDFISVGILEVTRDDINNYLDNQISLGLSVSTVNRRLASIKSLYRYLVIEEKVLFNPAELIESGKPKKSLPTVVTVKQFEKIIKGIDNLRDRLIIELFFASGIRREELSSLKRNHIDLIDGSLCILGKGNKERIVPLYDSILSKLSLWLSQHESIWVFPSPRNKGEHLSSRQVNDIVKKWSELAGFNDITPHSFRHSFGTYLYDGGADIKAIQEMMGHESIDTTNIYTKTSLKRNRVEYLNHHPLNKRDS